MTGCGVCGKFVFSDIVLVNDVTFDYAITFGNADAWQCTVEVESGEVPTPAADESQKGARNPRKRLKRPATET